MIIGILASGTGSNAQAILERINSGALQAEVGIIITNRAQAKVLEKAERFHIPSLVVERNSYPSRVSYDEALVAALKEKGCTAVILAGYMLVVGPGFLEAFPQRVLNIHPALLPAFPGTEGIKNAYYYGVKITGPSVHFVDEQLDSGPLIIQGALPVRQDESMEELAVRIHQVEHRIFPMAVQWLAEERLTISGRTVHLKPGSRALIPSPPETLIWPPLEEGF